MSDASTYDVIVVGSGAAGLSAAATARKAGAEVLLLEAGAEVGGTSAKSGGVHWIPNNPVMREEGRVDERDDALRYMARTAFPTSYSADAPLMGLTEHQHDMLASFYDEGPDALEALREMGALQSRPAMAVPHAEPVPPEILNSEGLPDYHGWLDENKAPYGRALAPKTGEGAVGYGEELVAQLQKGAEDNGVEIRVGHRVVDVERDGAGRVTGVEVENGGKRRGVTARSGVIFTSGGFTQNPDMSLQYLRGPIFGGGAVSTNRGDFVHIAGRLGADFANMGNAWLAEVPLEAALESREQPDLVWVPYGDSMLIVNRYGKRVVNEKLTYHDRTMVHFHWDGVKCEYPNLLLFMVYDDAVAQRPEYWPLIWPVPPAGESSPWIITADTLPALGAALEERLEKLAPRTGEVTLDEDFGDGLQASVERFNEFARAGKDLDFDRGERQIEHDWNGPPRDGNDANRAMFPLADEGPYHCVILAAGTLDTCGGPKIDSHARVLDADGTPIEGLYGAGNCTASISGQAYWAAGGTLGPALVFGHVAGREAAARNGK
jgi:3-oxosteroid 1-dehydrogenase